MLPTYLFATVDKQELKAILTKLKQVQYVNWFGSTSGRFDVIASFKGNDMQKTDAAIKEIRGIHGVTSTTAVVPFEGSTNALKDDERAMAQVFLGVNKPLPEMIQSLKNIPGVTEVLAISGQWGIPTDQSYRVKASQMWHPWEIIATVRGHSYEEILAKTVDEISQVSGVTTSETAFVYQPTMAV